MTYYALPSSFRPGLEGQIIASAERALLGRFKAAEGTEKTQGTQARTPAQALATWRVPPATRLELVAAEPLVQSPVAIDFAPDGALLVAEMRDYPSGENGDYQPGGAVRRLTDINGDGSPDILVSAFLGMGGEPQIAAFQYLDLSRLLNVRYALSSFDETVLLK